MRTPNLSAAGIHRRGDHLIGTQLMHQKADSSNIGNRIHCSDLVEMDLGDRNIVNVAFSLSDQVVDT